MEFFVSTYMYMLSCLMFCFNYKHLLLTIISLEFMMMNLVYNMFLILMNFEINKYMIIILMVFTVCEGALSLSLIVMLVRLYGNDYINSLSLLKW